MFHFRPAKRLATAVVCVAWLLLCVPAANAEPVLMSRTVSTVSGAEAAAEFIERVDGVRLGSSGATVTLVLADGPKEISIDFRDVVERREGSPAFPYAAALMLGVVVFRGLSYLLRLGRER